MRILSVSNKKCLCEVSHEEIRELTGRTLWVEDLKKLQINETEINILKIVELSNNKDISNINRGIESLESAINFLKQKRNAIEYLSEIKE